MVCLVASCATAKKGGPDGEDQRLKLGPSVLSKSSWEAGEKEGEFVRPGSGGEEGSESAALQQQPEKSVPSLEPEKPVKGTPKQDPVLSDTKQVQVTFDKMPLNQFVHHVFGDVLGVNYLTADQVSVAVAPITLNLKNSVSERRLLELVKEVLVRQGIDVVYKDAIFYVWPVGQKPTDVRLGVGRQLEDVPATPGEILQLIPLQYGDINDILALMKEVLKLNIQAYPKESMLAVRGTRSQVESALDFLSIIDRPAMRGRHVSLFMLTYWNVGELMPPLAQALTHEGIPVSQQAGQNGLLLMPLHRINSFIAFAAEKAWLSRVRAWVQTLDIPSKTLEKSYFVYTPKYATARDMSESLTTILGFSKSGPPQKQARGGRGAKETQEPAEGQRAAGGAPLSGQKTEGPAQWTATVEGRKGGEAAEGLPSSEVASDVQFAVDQSRNALIFYCSAHAYGQMQHLLQKLDQIPVQVVIDASVIEVTLVGSLSFGVQWAYGQTGDDYRVSTDLGVGSGTFNFIGLFNKNKLSVNLSALAKENLIKVLSNPKLTVRDGKSARITVGTEVPVVSMQSSDPDATNPRILQSIQYRNTGIMLEVTPNVNAQGVVTLQINQEVSEASKNPTSGIDSPIIMNRSLSTEVVTGDGQTVVLGGLIKENKSTTDSRVPGVGNIPILGRLFKNESEGVDRTELLILITPRILSSPGQIDILRKEIMEGFSTIEYSE